jgi:hypothetical protein
MIRMIRLIRNTRTLQKSLIDPVSLIYSFYSIVSTYYPACYGAIFDMSSYDIPVMSDLFNKLLLSSFGSPIKLYSLSY